MIFDPSQRRPPIAPPDGRLLPRTFGCGGCGTTVRETIYGQGFRNCGAFMRQRQHNLCEDCCQVLAEALDDLRERNNLNRISKEESDGDRRVG